MFVKLNLLRIKHISEKSYDLVGLFVKKLRNEGVILTMDKFNL